MSPGTVEVEGEGGVDGDDGARRRRQPEEGRRVSPGMMSSTKTAELQSGVGRGTVLHSRCGGSATLSPVVVAALWQSGLGGWRRRFGGFRHCWFGKCRELEIQWAEIRLK